MLNEWRTVPPIYKNRRDIQNIMMKLREEVIEQKLRNKIAKLGESIRI